MESDSRSRWSFGLSLVEVMLLLVFGAMMVYVTDGGEGRGQDTRPVVERPPNENMELQASLDAAMEKNRDLAQQLSEATLMMDGLKVMVAAKVPTKEGFQEAVDNLKRGYAFCDKSSNTLIEASVQNGEETVTVIGEIPPDLRVSLTKGDQTSNLEDIVSFLQDLYQYEKDRNCRYNYRLKYATDNDRRMAREGYGKYMYPEK
jgi:hypothetical protein